MLLPTTCPVCAAPGPAPCAGCAGDMRPAPALPPPAGVESCAALLAYAGAGRELVARLKYRNARASVRFLARGMADVVTEEVDVVTWAPTTPARLRARGFDQAGLRGSRSGEAVTCGFVPGLARGWGGVVALCR